MGLQERIKDKGFRKYQEAKGERVKLKKSSSKAVRRQEINDQS